VLRSFRLPGGGLSPALALPEVLSPLPAGGRRFTGRARVRLGDVDRDGRLRLDATARFLQDVANDDAMDAIPDDAMNWVLRRSTVEVVSWPGFREDLTLTTWSSGVGSRWAERRTSIEGDRGGRIEAAALWVHVEPATGRPLRLPASFAAIYAEAHGGRVVHARTRHASPPSGAPGEELLSAPWAVRAADIDLVGHVNNAVYWQMVEEILPPGLVAAGLHAEVEYRGGLEPGEGVELAWRAGVDGGVDLWVNGGAGVAASARMKPSGYTP
jgi:acyl-ACP thioesterase